MLVTGIIDDYAQDSRFERIGGFEHRFVSASFSYNATDVGGNAIRRNEWKIPETLCASVFPKHNYMANPSDATRSDVGNPSDAGRTGRVASVKVRKATKKQKGRVEVGQVEKAPTEGSSC